MKGEGNAGVLLGILIFTISVLFFVGGLTGFSSVLFAPTTIVITIISFIGVIALPKGTGETGNIAGITRGLAIGTLLTSLVGSIFVDILTSGVETALMGIILTPSILVFLYIFLEATN